MDAALIDIDSLQFGYPDAEFELRIPSFRVGQGERVAVIGPSGSGKTTLLNLIARILVPQQGRVHVAGEYVSTEGDGARRDFRITRIGFVFQDFELIEYLNVLDNVLHPYRITAALQLKFEVRKRAETLLAQMGLGDKLRRGVENLSQGEKQRVADLSCTAVVAGNAVRSGRCLSAQNESNRCAGAQLHGR